MPNRQRNRRRPNRRNNRPRAIDRVQSRRLDQIKTLSAVSSPLPADPPHLNRSFSMDMVLDWVCRQSTAAGHNTGPSPGGPGTINIGVGTSSHAVSTSQILEAIASRFGFTSASYPSWVQAVDSIAIVKISLWGPTSESILTNVDNIIVELPFHGPGYAVSGNSQAATVSDSTGKTARARCALTPPVLNWWDPRYATGPTAYTLLRVAFSGADNTAVVGIVGLLRVTIRAKFGVSNVAGSPRQSIPLKSRIPDEENMDQGGEEISRERTFVGSVGGLSNHLAGMAVQAGVSEIGSRIVASTLRRAGKGSGG